MIAAVSVGLVLLLSLVGGEGYPFGAASLVLFDPGPA